MSTSPPSPTIRRVLRGFVVIEVLSTLGGAVATLVAPDAAMGPLVTGDLVPQAAALAPHAGASWLVIALLLLGTLRLHAGDGRVLRLILVPILVGDILHLGAMHWLVQAHGAWTMEALAVAAIVLGVAAYRSVIIARPRWFLPTA